MLILIRGANDIGSAVAHVLFTTGYSVLLHENLQPTTARRGMSFTDTVFDGYSTLQNISAELVSDDSRLHEIIVKRKLIPLSIKDISTLIENLHPHILIDARMRKHQRPESQRGFAPLTIGLGPNFIAGETVNVGIETGWGISMGRIVQRGATNPLGGEPREIEGHARDRYVYAPSAGLFQTKYQIGDQVKMGDEVALINSTPLTAPISGVLRGLTRDGVSVLQKTKVIEIDPREIGAQVYGISERAARIADGVLSAVKTWEKSRNF